MTDEWYVIYFVLPGNNTAPAGATFRPPGGRLHPGNGNAPQL
jgi:hypothetical protein